MLKVKATVNGTDYQAQADIIYVRNGENAKYVTITGPTEFIYTDGSVSPLSVTLTQTQVNIPSQTYQWQYHNGATWTNIAGQTNNMLVVSPTNTYFSGNYVLIRCIVNGYESNILSIKKTYNYTKQLIIEQVDGTIFSSTKPYLRFKQKKIDLTSANIVIDVTNQSGTTWKLKTGGTETNISVVQESSEWYAKVNRSDLVNGSQILEVTQDGIMYKQQVTLNDIKDGFALEIVPLNGTSIYFKQDGTQSPAGQQLTFKPVVTNNFGETVQVNASNITWQLIPEQGAALSLISGTQNVQKATLTVNSNQYATVNVDFGYEDVLSIMCTYSENGVVLSKIVPITITYESQEQQYVMIDAVNGHVYTTQDVNETKQFKLKLIKNGSVQPIVDQQKIQWYLAGTKIQEGIDTINITYGQIQSTTQVLKVVYKDLSDTITLSKLTLLGQSGLSITSSNGIELTQENQSTILTQTLYINSQIKTANSYQWYKDMNIINGQTSNSLTITINDVNVANTFKCVATYGSNVYEAIITIIDRTDTYNLKILDTNNAVKNEFQFTINNIDYQQALNSTQLTFKPTVYLGTQQVSGNINVTVYRNNFKHINGQTYSNGASITLNLGQLVSPTEVSSIYFTGTVNIEVSYTPAGQKAPITLSKQIILTITNNVYAWLSDWKNNTTITDKSIATGKLFVGSKVNYKLNGVYIGDGSTLDSIAGTSNQYDTSIVQLKDNYEHFKLYLKNNNVNFFVGNDAQNIQFDTASGELKVKGKIMVYGSESTPRINVPGLLQCWTTSILDDVSYIQPEGYTGATLAEKILIDQKNVPAGSVVANLLWVDKISASHIDQNDIFSQKYTIKTNGAIVSEGKTSYSDTNAGLYLDKTSFQIYKDTNTYFKFDTTNGIDLKAAGVMFNSSGLSINKGTIKLGGDTSGNNAKIILNSDGSGSLQSGQISWNQSNKKLSVIGNIDITSSNSDNGKLTINGTTMSFGKQIDGTNDGLYINSNNYWYSNGTFRVGTTDKYLSWTGTDLTVQGTIYARGGEIKGNINITSDGTNNGQLIISGTNTMKFGINVNGSNSGLYINSNNYWYSDGNFKVGSTNSYLQWNGQTLTVKGTINATAGSIDGNLIVNGSLYSNNHTNFSDNTQGFWIGKDSSIYKFVVGDRNQQKYLEFDGTKTNQVGDFFGLFVGDAYLYNTEFKKDSFSSGVVYQQDLPQVYRYDSTGLELLKTFGSNQYYIVSLQNNQLQPANVWAPKTGGTAEGQVTLWVGPTNNQISWNGSPSTVYYRVEVQVYKEFPQNYFKGQVAGERQYQTLIFDFSSNFLYNPSYTNAYNTVNVSFDPNQRTVTVTIDGISKTLTQRSDITKISARAFMAVKRSSNTVDAGMYYVITTKDAGHQLMSVTIDKDQVGDTIEKFDPSKDPRTYPHRTYGIVNQRTFNGVATQAYFADLQEYLWSDKKYEAGTPVQIKDGKVVKQYNPWKKFWIVSTNPGFIMGKGRQNSVPVALAGTVEVNLDQQIDDEVCIALDGSLKVASLFDKLTLKYIVGRVVKKLDNNKVLLLLY